MHPSRPGFPPPLQTAPRPRARTRAGTSNHSPSPPPPLTPPPHTHTHTYNNTLHTPPPQDPFNEDDWASYTAFTAKGLAQIVGDDLLCTNPVRVQKAIDTKACNALLLKVRRGVCGREAGDGGGAAGARAGRGHEQGQAGEAAPARVLLLQAACLPSCQQPRPLRRLFPRPGLQVNQIGSLTESIKAVQMSKAAGWGVMTSHR